MPRSRGRAGRPWRRARATLFATTPDVCWLCGHTGTQDADHDPPLVTLEALGLDPCDLQYLRRAHGVDGCPTCGRKCNQEKGSRPHLPKLDTSRRW
ncbi:MULTISPECIES: hypothetical protein [unclassified Nonomuraea]|uniref:hypothetical protein n=1 Tax=unclassified Nonomuraea TaxID=2593643 RepID=UPI0033E2BCBE